MTRFLLGALCGALLMAAAGLVLAECWARQDPPYLRRWR